MNGFRKIIGAAAVLMILCGSAQAETTPEDAEQGLEEIQQLLEITEAEEEKEGMSLEEMTDAFSSSAMSEYHDSATGFSMQYPSVFMFSEELPVNSAATADGKATLTIDHMENQGTLDEEMLTTAISLEAPDVEIRKNEQNGCLRIDRVSNEGKTAQTDLYLLTEKSFHHITVCYPADERDIYFTYIDYMINTMETNETDLG